MSRTEKCLACDGKGSYIHNGITLLRDSQKIIVSKRWKGKRVKCRECGGKK